jgi:hypothetical protein
MDGFVACSLAWSSAGAAGMSGENSGGSSRWLMPVAIFCVVALAQLWLVAAAGTDIPFQDQWDAEGRGLYPAMRDGSASIADLFQPHNEHRIVWTLGLNRGLFSLNGQWDPLIQLSVGALLHAAIAGLLAAMLGAGTAGGVRWVPGLAVTLFSLPLAGWHNALWGFQSQVYFALLFALAAFALLAVPVNRTGRAVAGWVTAGGALLAMGPGMLVPIALAGWLGLRAWEGNRRWRDLPAVMVLALLAWSWHRIEPAHAGLRAESLRDFLLVLGRLLAWPYSGQPWAAFVLNLPLAVMFGKRLLKRREARAGEDFIFVMAGWTLLVALAAAWSRGGSGEFFFGVPSRYADFMALLPMANVWCAVQLADQAGRRVRLVALAWGACLFAGWLGLSAEVMRGIILPRARDREAPVRLARAFQLTGDAAVFAAQPRLLVPHPNPESVRAVLTDPRMQGALPPSLQPDRPMGWLSRGVRRGLGR